MRVCVCGQHLSTAQHHGEAAVVAVVGTAGDAALLFGAVAW